MHPTAEPSGAFPDAAVHPAFSLALGFGALALIAAIVVGRPVPPAQQPQQERSQVQVQALAPLQHDTPNLEQLVPIDVVEEPTAPPPPSASPRHHARATQAAQSPARVRTREQSPATNPEAACRHDSAQQLCTVFRCALPRFRQHPLCVRMAADGARRLQLASARGGP